MGPCNDEKKESLTGSSSADGGDEEVIYIYIYIYGEKK